MSSNVTLNGVQYIVPAYNDIGWAQGAGNLSLYLAAIATATLQPTGGSFTLTADADFGSNFGLKALYLKSETANIATAGVLRLAKTDSIGWRNNANGADKLLSIDGSDNLQYASTKVLLSGAVVNADINAAAAIAYSKLALTGSIVNADISASAAIAYSKLTLTGSIVNADIGASAAIAYSKLTLTGSIVNADINASAAIAYSKLTLTGAIVNADIGASAAIAYSKLNLATSIVNGDIAASTINLTQKVTGTLPVLNGGTGVTTSTGSGNNVLSTSPTLVTPALGAATATSINFGQTSLAFYEEGTFTPVLKFGGGVTGIAYSQQVGRYTRIGRMVQYEIIITLTSKGSSTGSATITGSPYTAGSRAYTAATVLNMAASVTYANVEMDTVTWFLGQIVSGNNTALSDTSFTNTSAIKFTGTFSV